MKLNEMIKHAKARANSAMEYFKETADAATPNQLSAFFQASDRMILHTRSPQEKACWIATEAGYQASSAVDHRDPLYHARIHYLFAEEVERQTRMLHNCGRVEE